jgi:anti-sigma B factor antagonist
VVRVGDAVVSVEVLSEGVRVVRVAGDLDLATVSELEQALSGADPVGRLVIDLSACTFLDSSALRAIAHAGRTSESARGDASLVVSDPGIRRVLQIAALDTILPVYATLGDAL